MTEQNKTDSVGDDVFVEKVNNLYEATYEDEVEPSCNPSDIEDLIKEIKKANTEWENIIMGKYHNGREAPPTQDISEKKS